MNKYNDQASIALLKSTPMDPALNFLSQNPELLNCNDLEILEKESAALFFTAIKCTASIEHSGVNILLA